MDSGRINRWWPKWKCCTSRLDHYTYHRTPSETYQPRLRTALLNELLCQYSASDNKVLKAMASCWMSYEPEPEKNLVCYSRGMENSLWQRNHHVCHSLYKWPIKTNLGCPSFQVLFDKCVEGNRTTVCCLDTTHHGYIWLWN